MYDVERDEIFFGDKDFPVIISAGKSATGMYSRFHEEVEIKYVNSGRLTVMIDTEAVTAAEGEIIFINPYEVHSNLYIDGDESCYDLVMLKLDFFDRAGIGGIDLHKLFTERRISFRNLIKNRKAADVMQRLAQSAEVEDEFSKLYISGLLLELFAILQQEETVGCDGVPDNDRVKFFRSIEPAVMEIRDNYSSKLSGDMLAAMCKMSRFHFCRTFKRVMGVTPVQYQTECRLHIADVLLTNCTLSISEIALQVGFEDEAYFSRCYKKHRGLSPKSMRAKLSK